MSKCLTTLNNSAAKFDYKLYLVLKIMCFAGFLRSDPFLLSDPYLECQRFVNLAVYFIRSSLILSCSSRPFFLYYAACWNGREGRERRREIVKEWSSIFNLCCSHYLYLHC